MINLLLKEISHINQTHDLVSKKTGVNFNIFKITNIFYDEVKICRIITELLNPTGSHSQGDIYLRLFFEYVLNFDFDSIDFSNIKVYKEYLIKNNRRIDIVIENNDFFIPIEVKIYADDQENQCFDYFQYARNSNLYYLTLFGNSTSAESTNGLIKEDSNFKGITNISFKTEILNWLKNCLENINTIRLAPIREIFLQLIYSISEMTNEIKEDKELDIIKAIMSSKENITSALEIEQTLPKIKTIIIENLFDGIKDYFENFNIGILYYEKDNIFDYYNFRTSPRINLKIKDLSHNLIASIGIEIYDTLFYYYSFMEFNEENKIYENISLEKIKKNYPIEYKKLENSIRNLETNKFKKTQIAIYWDYLYNNSNEVFTFKQFSPSCLEFYRKDNNMTLNISSLIKEKIEFIQQNLISKD